MSVLDRALANSVPLIPRPVVKRISSRYIAGERMEEMIQTIRSLNREGCVATVDVLGESTKDKSDALGKLRQYEEVLEALDESDLDAGISVKLTAIGLTLDRNLCRANLEEIIRFAARRNRFVRVDMEGSPYTSDTLDLVLELRENHENVGAVIQAYMRRSLADVQRLGEAGVSVRLCKGIYDEPREVAYKDFDTVRENYVLLLLEELFLGRGHVAIATHDGYLVWHAQRLIHKMEIPKSRYEFQTLLGVDDELQKILVGEGHRLRVYVPFGEDWYEYSTRRLKENPKIARYVAQDVIGSVTGAAGKKISRNSK